MQMLQDPLVQIRLNAALEQQFGPGVEIAEVVDALQRAGATVAIVPPAECLQGLDADKMSEIKGRLTSAMIGLGAYPLAVPIEVMRACVRQQEPGSLVRLIVDWLCVQFPGYAFRVGIAAKGGSGDGEVLQLHANAREDCP